MSRYIIRAKLPAPKAWDINIDEPFRPHLDVDGASEVDTGLVDTHGNIIMRLPPPIGFGRMEEW